MTDYSSSAATVKTALDAVYQAKLVSGTNIKTINNESLLGSGNISISGGGGGGGTTILIDDDCSTTPSSSNYGTSKRMTDGQTSVCELQYDSTNQCYKLVGSGNYISGLNVIPLNSKDDVTLRVKFKLSNANNYCQLILAVTPDLSNNTAFYGVRQMNGTFQHFWASGNSSGNTSDNTSISNITSTWHYLELKRSGTDLTCKIYDESMNSLASFIKTIPSWNDCYYLIGRNTENTSYYTLISEVYSEQSGGGGGSSVDIVTSWESTPSDSKVPSEKLVKDSLDDLETLVGNAITYINQ